MFISDVIKPTDYLNWGDSDIYIQAPTGSGKTYFILNCILPMAMQQRRGILILCNRKNLYQQYITDISNNTRTRMENGDFSLYYFQLQGLLRVATYQAIAESTQIDRIIGSYGIIVCDEVHALYADSHFATGLYKAFDKLVNWSMGRLMLYVSATAEHIFPILYQETCRRFYSACYFQQPDWSRTQSIPGYYRLEEDYTFCNVRYLEKIQQIPVLIADDQDPNSKWLIFVSSVREGKAILKGLEELGQEDAFLLTKDTVMSEKGEKISEQLVSTHTFDCKVLISTLVLEAGVSVCETNVKNIVDLHYLRETFIQTLGRKRMQENENLNVYILNRNAQFWAGKQNFCMQILKEYQTIQGNFRYDLQRHIATRLLAQAGNEVLKTFVYYDDGFRFNGISILKAEQEKQFYSWILKMCQEDGHAFIREQLAWMGLESAYSEENWVKDTCDEECSEALSKCLEKYAGCKPWDKTIFREIRIELTAIIHKHCSDKGFKSDQPAHIDKLNKKFQELHLPYEILKKTVKRKQTYRIERKTEDF